MGDVLVIAEHQEGKFPKSTLVGISAGLELASKTSAKCHGIVLASAVDALAEQLAQYGLASVLAIEGPAFEHYLADAYTAAIAKLVSERGFGAVVGAATAMGKDLLPRLAARLGVGMASEVVAINGDGTFIRPMYAGNAVATVRVEGAPVVISVRLTAFDPAAPDGNKAPIEKLSIAPEPDSARMKFLSLSKTKSDRPVLTEARVVVSGGRGLKSGENFTKYLEPLCEVLGAAMGATRAAVDAGFVPNDLQVGQTGKVVAPELYIAIGISGAIQHLAGMKDSKVIVAINKDEEAPIFSVADYGLVADLFKVVPELTEELKKVKA